MRPLINTLILLAVAAVVLGWQEFIMQTWRPMFLLIICSMAVAIVAAFLIFRLGIRHGESRIRTICISCAAVFCFIAVWKLLWAISEEGLIHYYLATYGEDDTGGRYFYPGNSGMGYAVGLGAPMRLFTGILIGGLAGAVFLGIPLGLRKPHGQAAENKRLDTNA